MDFSENYSKKRMLGKGNQAVVWLVENHNTGAAAAMKLYDCRSAETEREIQVLKDLGGKGIPYLIDCVEADGKSGIVMEYVEGKSLRALCREQRIWTEEEAVETAIKIAEILNRFHRTVPVMVYADLKPENIMLTPTGEVYLVDFGAVVYEGERGKRLFGTKGYLPPAEEEKVTPYRDTYGLGVILYEMLTGYRVSEGILNGKADVSHLSAKCRQVMQKAVRIHSGEGYSNAGQMLEDLKEWQNELEERQKGRGKRRMKRKRKKGNGNYFICDLKRAALHGRVIASEILCVCMIAAGLFFGGKETEAAGVTENLMTEKFIKGTEIIKTEYRTETEPTGVTSKDETADQQIGEGGNVSMKEEETARDEYGRKLVIRGL